MEILTFIHKGETHTIKPCCGQRATIYTFDDHIQFQCRDRCRILYVYGYDLPEAYLFWNLMVDNDMKQVVEVNPLTSVNKGWLES